MPQKYNKYNIVFNSRKGTPLSGNRANTDYTFDFGILPEGEYQASFAYMGQENDLVISNSHNYKVAEVYMNIGKSKDFIAGNGTGTVRYNSSNFMGFLEPNRNEAYSYLFSHHQDNPPVSICRPTSNQVNIQIRSNLDALYVDSSGGALNHYVLALHLELVTEYDNVITKKMTEDVEEYEEVEVEVDDYDIPNIFLST